MPEKGLNLPPSSNAWILRTNPLLQWRFGALTALVFIGMVVIWSLDGSTIKGFLEAWKLKENYQPVKVSDEPYLNLTENLNHTLRSLTHDCQEDSVPRVSSILNRTLQNLSQNIGDSGFSDRYNLTQNRTNVANSSIIQPESGVPSVKYPGWVPLIETQVQGNSSLDWVSVEFRPNLTKNLLKYWLTPGGEPCKDSRTVEIMIPGLDGQDLVELSTGDVHEIVFQALDGVGKPVCLGGDYFEVDLSGEAWKSRPVITDFGNGSYSVLLQVHPDFAGDYNLTVHLLFRHFEGLKFSPPRFAFNKELRHIPIRFSKSEAKLPDLKMCQKSDFSRDVWVGRWTRHGKNDDCEISSDGRYRCLPSDFPCTSPWCDGSLGMLESNGWVYSAHCSFRLFSANAAWNCLKNRWIFFWGDSNHVDTIRNMLNFMLDLPGIRAVPRRFDMNFSNPRDPTQSVRITSIFNGHWNETGNYQGLNSLQDAEFRDLLRKYFLENTVPDTIIMNSGLHDGVFWTNIRRFIRGADFAVKFWAEVLDSVRKRGLEVPKVYYRNTVATGGYARTLSYNPSKMEAYNQVQIEKLKESGILSGVIDNFDLTFPWHFDNRCNDGVHYGRAPAKYPWKDGLIGHQYFVDLMLCHVLLNALCSK